MTGLEPRPGMEMPTTMAELNEYLYKIKELDPYGNGETIPLILGKRRFHRGPQYCGIRSAGRFREEWKRQVAG